LEKGKKGRGGGFANLGRSFITNGGIDKCLNIWMNNFST